MISSNRIKNVAIVGISGNSGSYIATELLKTGKHHLTALIRTESTGVLPAGVTTKPVDYDDHNSLVSVLQDQDALIITMSARAPLNHTTNLIRAAADAAVAWILPNEWCPDTTNASLIEDIPPFQKAVKETALIQEICRSSFAAVTCGFWYEWGLTMAPTFGFNVTKREVTLFDDGNTPINTTTWPQLGRAVAALLSLPVEPETDTDPKKCLAHFRNQHVRISSFLISQKDMLESLLCATETVREDWTVNKEPAVERYEIAIEAMKQGDWKTFGHNISARVFYPKGGGDFESSKGLHNEILDLQQESLDEATARAVVLGKARS